MSQSSLRALAALLALLVLAPPSSFAGTNAGGTASLTWDRAGSVSTLTQAPAGAFPLFLQLRNAPDIRALAAHVIWSPHDSSGACFDLISCPGPSPSTPLDSLYGWAADTPPGRDFNGDAYTWTISFASGTSAKNCVAYLVSGSGCDAATGATFLLARVMVMDSNKLIDTLKVVGGADIVPPSGERALAVDQVDPTALPAGQPTKLVIRGRGFESGARVFIASDGQRIEASDVFLVDSLELLAQVTSRFRGGVAIDVVVRLPSGVEAVGRSLIQGASAMSSATSSSCALFPSNADFAFRQVGLYSNREVVNVFDFVNHPEWPSWLDNDLRVIRAPGDTVGVITSQGHSGLGLQAPSSDMTSRVRFLFDPPRFATSIATLVTSGRTYKDGSGEFADAGKPLLRMKASYETGDSAVLMLAIGTHVRNWVSGQSECPSQSFHSFYDSHPSDPLVAEILSDPTYHYDLQEWRLPGAKRSSRLTSLEFLAQPVNRTQCPDFYGTSELCGIAMWPKFEIENPAGEQVPLVLQNRGTWSTAPYGGFYRNGVLHGTRRTIGKNGCNLSCYTMVHNYLGTSVTPPELNDFLQRKADGYSPETFATLTAVFDTTLQYKVTGTVGRPVGDTVFVLSRDHARPIAAAVVRDSSSISTAGVVEVFEAPAPAVGAPVASYGFVSPYWAAEGFPGSRWKLVPLQKDLLGVASVESTLCDSMPVILHVKEKSHFILATGWAPAFTDTGTQANGTYLVNDPRWPVTRLVQQRYGNAFCEARACKRLPAARGPSRASGGQGSGGGTGRLVLSVRSDSRFYLEDPLGRTVRYDEDAGQYAGDVPDLVALRQEVIDDDDDSTLVSDPVDLLSFSAPVDGDYHLSVQAESDGDFDVFAAAYDDVGGTEGNIDLISLTAGTQGQYRMTYSGSGVPTARLHRLGVVGVPTAQPASRRLVLRTVGNPGFGEAILTCQGGAGRLLALDIFDIHGRRLRRFEAEADGTGPVRLRWDGHTDHGTRAAPGVYTVRARRGPQVAMVRIVLLR